MIGALQNVFKRKKLRAPLDTTINRVEISVEERMTEIEIILEKGKAPILFDDLFSTPSKQHIVSTFLAILQLLKNGKIQCTQTAQIGRASCREREKITENERHVKEKEK